MVHGKSHRIPVTAQQAFALALQHHQAGRWDDAEMLYRQILAAQPNHAEAWQHLGLIAHQKGRSDLAAQWIAHAIVLNPNNHTAHFNLGEACRANGRRDDALASFRRALQLAPNHFQAWLNLGSTLREQGRLAEAIVANRRAIELQPDHAGAYYNLGNALRESGGLSEAVNAYRNAIEYKPDWAEAYHNLGNGLREQGQFDEAVAAYRRAVAIRPDYPEACNSLGILLSDQGRFGEAAAAYRRALELRPNYPEAYNNLGIVLARLGLLDEATAAYRRALAIRPDYPEARNNLGGALLGKAQVDEAMSEFRDILRLHPDSAWVHSNLVYAHHFHPTGGGRRIAEEQERWNRQFGSLSRRTTRSHRRERDPGRRLRIGYVSPYFREHVIGRNLWPLFQHHDHEEFEIFCYADAIRPDAFTGEFRKRAAQWRNTAGMSDEAFADAVHRDGVDILVDLTLHMEGNRLPAFAHRPAPVQASFAGYPASTGVNAIRYRISDRYLEVNGVHSAAGTAEQVCLIDSFWCYDPREGDVPVNELPAQGNGVVTFGSLNNFCKINEPLLRLWARIMNAVDGSRLILLCGKGDHRERTLEILRREGVESRRVEFIELLPRRDYLQQYHRLDIVLDPSPYNGHTTSLDALWMGVPVVTLVGETSVSRAGLSQLTHLGHPELAAPTEDDYVHIAAQLAHDLPRLAELRRTLREKMRASSIMNAPRFTRSIEAAYRAMWRHWCAENSFSPP